MGEAPFSANRDRLAPRLAKLARLLENPTLENITIVRLELERLAKG